MMRYYDNTRVSDFKNCPRYFYLRHIRDLAPISTALPLVFGLAWHDAMDIVWTEVKNGKSDEQIVPLATAKFVETWKEQKLPFPLTMDQQEDFTPRTPSVAAEMLYGYLKERRQFIQTCELLAVERPYAVPLYPGDNPTSPIYIGRLDKVVRHPNYGILIIEHKTTTAYKKEGGFRDDWVNSWSPNSQVDGYLHAGQMLYGNKVKGAWIDGALVHKTVHDKFKFIPVSRATASLNEWLHEVREWIERIRLEKNHLWHHNNDPIAVPFMGFPKNTGHCGTYSGCMYRDICRYMVDLDTKDDFPGYVVEKWEPFDILKIEQLGLARE